MARAGEAFLPGLRALAPRAPGPDVWSALGEAIAVPAPQGPAGPLPVLRGGPAVREEPDGPFPEVAGDDGMGLPVGRPLPVHPHGPGGPRGPAVRRPGGARRRPRLGSVRAGGGLARGRVRR